MVLAASKLGVIDYLFGSFLSFCDYNPSRYFLGPLTYRSPGRHLEELQVVPMVMVKKLQRLTGNPVLP